ncbi:MAG: hypothetical protein VYA43_04135, partial [Pseudomonadota bacterium]|nr:hypothetical protein [Pseudomonadota bacterium]
ALMAGLSAIGLAPESSDTGFLSASGDAVQPANVPASRASAKELLKHFVKNFADRMASFSTPKLVPVLTAVARLPSYRFDGCK